MIPDRPKRKATANKSYIDSVDETLKHDLDYYTEETNAASIVKRNIASRSSPSKNGSAAGSAGSAKSPNFKGPSIPYNWQALPRSQDYFSQRLDLTDAYIDLAQQAFYCPNHTSNLGDSQKKRPGKLKVQKGDYIYMVSEPPGEPYYIGRVMGFKAKGNIIESGIGNAKDYMLKIQWFYRPRDVSRGTSDSRLLFASMHSDTCPIGSFRGLVTVKHKYDIEQEYLAQQAGFEPKQPKRGLAKLKGGKSTLSSQTPNYLEEYLEQINCFYFDKLFDRYMIKFYDVLPTSQLLQYSQMDECKSRSFLVALHKRFEFIFVEPHQTKVLLKTFSSKACNCEKCGQWCASAQDSINCLLCQKYYHMMCLDPPLLRKPSRGFSWSCAHCTKEYELELHRNSSFMLSDDNKSSNASELASNIKALRMDIEKENGFDEENEASQDIGAGSGIGLDSSSGSDIDQGSTSGSTSADIESEITNTVDIALPKYEVKAQEFLHADNALTLEQRRLREEWSMRYLGLHARLEDGVDLEDRSPYPRASTRLGAKNQASNLPEFNGHPIVYYDPQPTKSRKNAVSSSTKKASTKKAEVNTTLHVPKEFADVPVMDYPDWLKPRPKGYIERGLDDGPQCTSTLLWKPLTDDIADSFKTLDAYMLAAEPIAESIGVLPTTPNFLDAALSEYLKSNGDSQSALKALAKWTKKTLKEPIFNREEVKRFEKGVAEFGSELHQVQKIVKSQPISLIVRYYYVWKKTEPGRRIWGNFDGRAQKKMHKANKDEPLKTERLLDASIGGDDDSSYDYEKTVEARVSFKCKFCHTRRSIQWFRVTGHEVNEPDNQSSECIALCFRCAKLWRRYAVSWEDSRLMEQNNKSHGWRRKIEYELAQDAQQLQREADHRKAYIDYDYEEPPKVFGQTALLRRVASDDSTMQIMARVKKATNKGSDDLTDPGDSKDLQKNGSVKNKPGPEPTVKKEPTKKDIAKKEKKPVAQKDPVTKQAARKEISSKKAILKKVTEQAKCDANHTSENEVPTANSKSEPSLSDTRKRKLKSETPDIILTSKSKDELKKPASRGPNQKRQKKVLPNQVSIPFLNQNYEVPHFVPRLDPTDQQIALINMKELKTIVDEYRVRQILNNAMQIQAQPMPNTQPGLDTNPTPFCAVCRETFDITSPNEIVCCTECNVTVHSVCVGLLTSSKIQRVVCDACANEVYPLHSTLRQCVLCPGVDDDDSKPEPQLLVSIADTGRWCHLQCALFNHDLVEFSNRQKLKSPKLVCFKGSQPTLESVTEALMINFTVACRLCGHRNGSLSQCRFCGPEHKFHITCAQKAENFTMGFTLEEASSKGDKLIRIGNETGKLVPTIICPDHIQHKESVYGFHHPGEREAKNRRTLGRLIELFLHNVCASSPVRNRKKTLIGVRSEKFASLDHDRNGDESLEVNNSVRPECSRCGSTITPAWWMFDNEDGQEAKLYDGTDSGLNRLWCHTCYHHRNDNADNDENEAESAKPDFIESLNRPLCATHYGIQNEHDHVCAPLHVLNAVDGTPPLRGQISIQDIMD